MTMMKLDLDQLINSFVRMHRAPFTVAELLRAAGSNVGRKQVEDALNTHPYVYKINAKYISRCCLFTGRPFSIAPLPAEIAAGMLIIGHRCAPFADPEILPHELTFTFEGETIPKKRMPVKTQEAFEHYALFGEEYAAQFFALDAANAELNFAELDYALPSFIQLTVLDMTDLYARWNFSAGDRLAASVVDWNSSIIALEPVFSTEKGAVIGGKEDEKRREWFDVFENALLESIEVVGPCESIDEQLVYAFIAQEKYLFSASGASIEEFLHYTKKIGFEEYGVETRLWKIDEEIPVCGLSEENGHPRMLDFFLGGEGFPVAESVLDAYLYDSLYKKEKKILPLVQRLVPHDAVIPKKLFEDFLLHLESRRDILMCNYNWFADYQKGRLRSAVLDLYAQVFDFVCSLESAGVAPEKLPSQPLIVLIQLYSHMLHILEAAEPDEPLSDKDFSAMYFSLEGMIDSFDDIKENLADALEKNTKERFSVVKN